jgi:hypothetical protein
MMGSAAATLASYGVMAVVLGIYSKRVMEVQYRMPLSFALMVACVAMVYLTPAVSSIVGVETTTGSWLMMLPGLAVIGIFVYYSERSV